MATATLGQGGSSPPPPPSSKRRNTSDGTTGSLRNSCQSCASSKVKCSGRKPTCHRCEERGIACEYSPAKRAGRKPAGSSSAAGGSNSGGASRPANRADNNHQEATDAPQAVYASPRGTASELSDIWSDINPLDQSLFADLSNINGPSSGISPEFQLDLPALGAAAPTAQMTTTDSLFATNMGGEMNANVPDTPSAALGTNVDPLADLFDFPLSPLRATGLATPMTRGSQTSGDSPPVAHPCSCLVQALGLLKHLSELLTSTSSAVAKQSMSADAIRTIQDIVQQNSKAVESITGWLNCQGRHDGYLLIVTSLAIFRMMELFRAVVPETPSSQAAKTAQSRRPSVLSSSSDSCTIQVGGHNVGGDDWARQSTQAILNELHDLRRLTRLLSDKLRAQTTSSSSGSTGASSISGLTPSGTGESTSLSKRSIGPDMEMRLPFSGEVYQQLAVDLDNRLKALSQHAHQQMRDF